MAAPLSIVFVVLAFVLVVVLVIEFMSGAEARGLDDGDGGRQDPLCSPHSGVRLLGASEWFDPFWPAGIIAASRRAV